MFVKLGNSEWMLYSNCSMVECIEIRPSESSPGGSMVMMCYISGRDVEVYSGSLSECEEFVEMMLSGHMGLSFAKFDKGEQVGGVIEPSR